MNEDNFKLMSPNNVGWDSAWAKIEKVFGDKFCECPETGEVWQYMGSTIKPPYVDSTGKVLFQTVIHQFRHRSYRGERTIENVRGKIEDFNSK